jgi:uncharacterized protein YecE (DUF72 family)
MDVKVGCCGFPKARNMYYKSFKKEKCQERCYCLFNNVSMWTDALAFQGMIGERKVP